MKSMITAFAALALSFSAAAAEHSVTQTLLTVREDGLPAAFTNLFGSVSDMARLQAQLDIAAAQARQAESIYAQTLKDLDDVCEMAVANRAIAYRRYFIDSWEAAMLIDDTRDKAVIVKFETADPSRARAGSDSFDVYYAFKGTTDIRTLKSIFKTSEELGTPTADWDYLADTDVDDPVSLGHPYTNDIGTVFNYTYRTTVHFPADERGFLVVSIQPQAADSDGSVMVINGGDKDGADMDVVVEKADGTRVSAKVVGGRLYTASGEL